MGERLIVAASSFKMVPRLFLAAATFWLVNKASDKRSSASAGLFNDFRIIPQLYKVASEFGLSSVLFM
jgi:hypothetical protein